MKRIQPLLLFGLFLFGSAFSRANQSATIITDDPVTFVQGAGHLARHVRPEEIFTVVSTTGDEITLSDRHGFQATLKRGFVKFIDAVPSSGSTNAVIPSTNPASAVVATNNPPASPPPATKVPATPAAVDPEDAQKLKRLNDVLQIPLFADANLWGDDVADVAVRLKWPRESQTSYDCSYRRYALDADEPVSVLGARAYSLALYGKQGHPTYISIVFANKGDFAGLEPLARKAKEKTPITSTEGEQALKDLNAAIEADADAIDLKMTAALGESETHVYGSTADSRESVHRWNWKGHAILLASARNEYTTIKIVPSEVADHYGDVANMDRETIKAEVAKRVVKNDNSDVLLTDIPMVDQGPKGYCVPATWERYLRYVDVPADMYVLAVLGNTGFQGGTSVGAIRAGMNNYVSFYGRRIESADVALDIPHVQKFINQGLPLMWTCLVTKETEQKINLHTTERQTLTGPADWEKYRHHLDEEDKSLAPLTRDDPTIMGAHMRLIIGYNSVTQEFAISDSWGSSYALRWISVREAQSTHLGSLDYIQW